MLAGGRLDARPAARRVALVYAAFGLTWIALGTTCAARTAASAADYETIELAKGAAFVALTSLLLLFLLRREFERSVAVIAAHSDRFRALADAMGALVFSADDRAVLTHCSEASRTLLGRAPQELVGRELASLLPPQDAAAARSALRELLAGGVAMQKLAGRVIHADGTAVNIEITASRSDTDGRVGIVGIVRDVTEAAHREEGLLRAATEQRELARQLHEERARLIEAQAVARVGTWETDLPTMQVRWTEETHRIFGTDPSAFVPTHAAFLELVHAEDRRRVGEAFQASMATTDVQTIQHRVVRPDGGVRIVEERWRCVAGPAGVPHRAVGTCRDVTDKHAAETELRESRRMIEHIVNAVPVRVFWKDRQLRYLGCNAAFARDAGCPDASGIVGRSDFDLVWRAQAESYRQYDLQVIESGSPALLVEEPQTTPAGDTITLLTSKIPLRNEAGEIIGVLGTYMDITARKRVEQEQARLATAVEQAAEAVVIMDEGGTVVYVNPAFETITGYSRDEVCGRIARFLRSGGPGPDLSPAMWSTIRAGDTWRGRVTTSRKDGALLEEDIVISPVRDAGGRTINYVAVKHDVTQEVRLQSELQQAQKMETVGRLAGGVAHDFNNILTVIQGYGEVVLAGLRADDPAREGLEQINRAADRAASLTRQLLAYSRKQVLQPQVLDLNHVVRNMERMLRRLIGEDVDLVTRHQEHVGRVSADPGQIEQVLVNLAVNARDAMPHGGTLMIETMESDLGPESVGGHVGLPPGRYVCLAVSDTGTGMDDETQRHLFEPFFTTKEKGKGTGLGLSTVYGIVKQSNGHVAVYSAVGRGTTFRIYLPRVERHPARPPTVVAKAASLRGGETILVVEDEPAVRSLVEQLLRQNGYTVHAAANGEAAIQHLRAHSGAVDLLLTDIVMPGMPAAEFAAHLSSLRQMPRVLYMSGYTDAAAVSQGVISPDTPFLQKPFSVDSLLRRVRETLDRPRTSS